MLPDLAKRRFESFPPPPPPPPPSRRPPPPPAPPRSRLPPPPPPPPCRSSFASKDVTRRVSWPSAQTLRSEFPSRIAADVLSPSLKRSLPPSPPEPPKGTTAVSTVANSSRHGAPPTKKRKSSSPALEAAEALWVAVVCSRNGEPVRKEAGLLLPKRFDSSEDYYSRLICLLLLEARASAHFARRQAYFQPLEVVVRDAAVASVSAASIEYSEGRNLWSVSIAIPRSTASWPTLRSGWIVELSPLDKAESSLFYVGRDEPSAVTEAPLLHLRGVPPNSWGWSGSEIPKSISCYIRPLMDMVPLLRMWIACHFAPEPRFLKQVLGLPVRTHIVFSDSDDSDACGEDTSCDDEKPLLNGHKVGQQESVEDFGVSKTGTDEGVSLAMPSCLNAIQQQVVESIVESKLDSFSGRCHILQGPPGTGKTRTVVALLQSLCHHRLDNGRKCILVCGPSNGSVQVALESFLQTPEGMSRRVCLVGVDEKVPASGPIRTAFVHTRLQQVLAHVQSYVRDVSLADNALKALEDLRVCAPKAYEALGLDSRTRLSQRQLQSLLFGTLKSEGILEKLGDLASRERCGQAAEFEVDQLRNAQLVFCTLCCSGRSNVLFALRGRVDALIVDEAAQAVEAETIIPFSVRPKQMVLVGDPMQLTATVCHSAAAKAALFCRSMMERMIDMGYECPMLREQYRMHPQISAFPSSRFYASRLIDSVIADEHFSLPPYLVVDVPNGREHSALSGSSDTAEVTNVEEATAAAEFAERIALLTEGSIVVLAFFRGQVALLQRLLHASGAGQTWRRRVEVHTVDSFQGDEAEVVILSFARANKTRRLGFLNDFRRLNVALTRAKRSLAIFANVAHLSATPATDDVAALFSDAVARKCVLSVAGAFALLDRHQRRV